MTSGLASALMDLAAFLVLLFVVARKAVMNSQEPVVEKPLVGSLKAGRERNDKIDIAP